MKKDQHRGYKIVIVPEDGRESRTYSFGPHKYNFIRMIFLFIAVSIIAIIGFWGYFASVFSQLDNLRSTNAFLESKVERIFEIEKNIVEMDEYIRYIRFAMSLTGEEQPPLLEDFAANDSLVNSYELSAEAASFDNIPNIAPIHGYKTNVFSEIDDHFGIDYSASMGSIIRATANGQVVRVYTDVELGNVVEIDHSNGYKTLFAHCSEIIAEQGDRVIRGETIARVGNSGTSTSGPHLHYEISKDGARINPEPLIIRGL